MKQLERFRSEKHNVFTEEINKIALSTHNDKIMKPKDSIETYAYRTNKEIIHKKKILNVSI